MQGGIDPNLPGTAYADIVRAVKTRGARHARARLLADGDRRPARPRPASPIRDWLTELQEAGLDTIPGTAAEILDDEVRWVLTKGKLPAATWVEVVEPRRTSWASGSAPP